MPRSKAAVEAPKAQVSNTVPPEQPRKSPAFTNTELVLLLIIFIAFSAAGYIAFIDVYYTSRGKNYTFTDASGDFFADSKDYIWMNARTFYKERIHWAVEHVLENMYIIQSAATCVSLVWLLFRAWQVLWKPVPELISILGIEVPESPEVSLAGIKSDAITLHWLRPEPDKPVLKYLIQVNGVNVGESGKTETAITVTGLKPGNFYNVRVIAVGASNFQAGSKVIRLRTYDKKGRPILHSGPAPTYDDDSESDNDATKRRGQGVAVEAVSMPESPHIMVREQSSGGHTSQRRNTGGRKHSPSIVAADQAAKASNHTDEPEETMQQLTEKFERIRRETEEVQAGTLRDEEEFKITMVALTKEIDEKRKILKEKEENSEKLRKEAATAERLNRAAQIRKTQKEKILKEKKAERAKMHEDMARWKKEVDEMMEERATWAKEAEEYRESKDIEAEKIREQIRQDYEAINDLDEQIKDKGLQIKDLESARINLPNNEDDEATQVQAARDRQEDLEWEITERNLVNQLSSHSQQLRDIGAALHQAQAHLAGLQANTSLMYHGNSSGVDFDPSGQGKTKSRRARNRKSRTSPVSSPVAAYSMADPQFPSTGAYSNAHHPHSPTFAPGPYIDMSSDAAIGPTSELMAGMSDEDIRALTANAPLSPTVASSLLPSNIFADDDPGFGPALYGRHSAILDNDPQSPHSSSRSASLMSSPQNSSHNLAMYGVSGLDYGAENDRRSINSLRADFGAIGSPASASQSTSHRGLRDIFPFPRARGKTMHDEGPTLGSLKQGQSQSLPRATDEPEAPGKGHRRTSFSANFSFFSAPRKSAGEASTDGNAPAPARNVGARRRRGFNMFGSSTDESGLYSERDPSSPRPVSIASSDLPRPSTDSAPFGWAPAADTVLNRNSPLATNWSINVPQTWSRNPSRRPSIQHSSTTALTSGIASEDDEFLPPADALAGQTSPPPSVGVIGAPRPVSSHKQITPKLNPAAPAFRGPFNLSFTRTSKADRDKEKDKGKGKGRVLDTNNSADESLHLTNTSSPPAPPQSRDSHSIHTQTSTAESHESLENTLSNTPSEPNTPSGISAKDKEASTIQRLLRKGSSSKFSISSFRNKDTGLFGGKKSNGSAANSDRNGSAERDGSFDEFGEDAGLGRSVDSVTSSPMIGSMGSGEWKGKDKDTGTPKEGRMSMNWGRFGIKGKKGRESLDVDRSETETTEDEA